MEAFLGQAVTALEAHPRRRGCVRVRIGGRSGPVLTEKSCVNLGVRVGTVWTSDLAARCARAAQIDEVIEKAQKLLSVKARSREQLRTKLLEYRGDQLIVAEALAALAAAGFIDDAAFAAELVRQQAAQGPGRSELAKAKLVAAGVEAHIIERAAAEVSPPAEDARALVRSRLAKAPAGEPRRKTAARVLRQLAARGFDEITARDALEEVMGTIGDDDDDDAF